MLPASAEEDAAVARVEAAYGQHDVAAITAELAAHLSSARAVTGCCAAPSARVVAHCCDALLEDELTSLAAASADVLLLVLEAVRRHADCSEVTWKAWLLAGKLVKLNTSLGKPAVEGGALELALATARDTRRGSDAVTGALGLLVLVLDDEHAARAVQLGMVEAAAQAMQRFPDDVLTQQGACNCFCRVLCVPDGVLRVREVNGGALVCAALRAHIGDAGVAANSCLVLAEMLKHGLASSIDATEAASLAEAARRAHPSDAAVQKDASDLTARLMALRPTSSASGVSPERAALTRVPELKKCRDFASLVRDMDAFPECEELQRAGCTAFSDMLDEGGSAKADVAAGAVECIVRALDLFQPSAETQRISLYALNALLFSELEPRPELEAVVSVVGNAGGVRLAIRALRSFPEDRSVIVAAFLLLGNVACLQQQFREEALRLHAPVLCISALRRCANDADVHSGACYCLARLCVSDDVSDAVTSGALSMGAMELALTALQKHRSVVYTCVKASVLLEVLCLEETRAVKAKQLGAPALLQAAMKAHPDDEDIHRAASGALARIQRFVDAARARTDAKMAELIAEEEAPKGGKRGAAAAKKAGKGMMPQRRERQLHGTHA